MSRKQPKRRAGNMVFSTIAGLFILAAVCGVGFGVASADSSDELARAGAFGFDEATTSATASSGRVSAVRAGAEQQEALYEQSVLTATAQRTIDAGLEMLDEREEAARKQAEADAAAERERIAAENTAALARVAAEKEKQGAVGALQAEAVRQAKEDIYEYDLPAVDWTVGREGFVAEWTSRIDAYLEGSPLAGYGWAFAEAAWDNGVDPRWSPAISNTESSKGLACFMPCNAWGWGEDAWPDWETAIRAHVAGLAEGYGYCITPEAAVQYCPPNSDYWYANTISQMASI